MELQPGEPSIKVCVGSVGKSGIKRLSAPHKYMGWKIGDGRMEVVRRGAVGDRSRMGSKTSVRWKLEGFGACEPSRRPRGFPVRNMMYSWKRGMMGMRITPGISQPWDLGEERGAP